MNLAVNLCLTRHTFELDIQLDFPLTGITALFGASGSGKTTLLRCLAGLEHARGDVRVGEETWQNAEMFLAPHRRSLGMIFQEGDLFPHLNVEQNLLFGYSRLSKSERRFDPARIIPLLNLAPLLRLKPHQLSGGERQRVALGRTLLRSPKLLLMDEPLSALDVFAREAIYPFLHETATRLEIPVLYVSHSLDEVARLSENMILLSAGKIAALGKTRDMLTRLDLPMAKGPDAEAVLFGSVLRHDDAWQLTYLTVGRLEFRLPRIAAEAGSEVRLRVMASDVSLSPHLPRESSILNIFPVIVREIFEDGKGSAFIKLDLAGASLLARITLFSLKSLGLRTGSTAFAQIKSAAVLV